jgi:hypothetical protein
MTQYITAEANNSDGPDSVPSTNGLRAAARAHGFLPLGGGGEGRNQSRRSSGSRNHSRKTSAEWGARMDDDAQGAFAQQQQQLGWTRSPGSSTPVSPRSSTLHSPRRSISMSTHSPHASISSQPSHLNLSSNVYQRGNMSSPQLLQYQHPSRQAQYSVHPLGQNQGQGQGPSQYASHQSYTPVRPVLSAVPAEPSTPAYNMLSAIAMRSPSGNGNVSDGGGGVVRSELGARFINDLGVSGIARAKAGSELGGRGRGGSGTWVRGPLRLGVGGSGLRRTRSATPSDRVAYNGGGSALGSPVVSPSKQREGEYCACLVIQAFY